MINTQAFSPAEVKRGLLLEFVECLLKMNDKLEDRFNEIHITSDGYCTIVEYETIPYNREYGGKFVYLDEDHVAMKEILLPDGSYEYASNEADEKFILDNFLREHPEYYKDKYGRWMSSLDDEYINDVRETLND